MKIVHANKLPLVDRVSGGRAGTWKRRGVFADECSGLGNFSLVIYYHDGSFYSPRHHHNFDQFRYQLDGTADFDRNGKMTPGVLSYHPEGAYYGPTSGPPHTVAVLQFGGPSGSGYMGSQETKAAREALRAVGIFEKGVYRRNPGAEGKKNQDSYEAVWEHVHQRKIVYPKPQYLAPVMVDTNNYPWARLEGVSGVTEQALGTFSNCEIRSARYRLDSGAAFVARGRGIYMVLSGGGTVEGEALQDLTTVYLDDAESVTFKADQTTTILLMGMPSVARMAKPAAAPVQKAAAE
jgi:hypothetical protein